MPEIDVAATRAAATRLDGEAQDLRSMCNGEGAARISDELAPLSGSAAFSTGIDLEVAMSGRLEGAASEFDALVAGLRALADNVEKATG